MRKANRSRTRDFEDQDDAPRAGLRGWITRHPTDAVCLFAAITAVGAIAANALFLQKGPHPAPIFAEGSPPKPTPPVPLPPAKRPSAAATTTASLPPPPAKQPAAPTRPARPDPIADLLEPSNRTIAAQRALTEFGYGQIKPTGTVGPETKAAIERFERERKLPVTGQLSERLIRELSSLKGAPL